MPSLVSARSCACTRARSLRLWSARVRAWRRHEKGNAGNRAIRVQAIVAHGCAQHEQLREKKALITLWE
eukprot:5315616-Pleurochrysis_carterae.AAC.1